MFHLERVSGREEERKVSVGTDISCHSLRLVTFSLVSHDASTFACPYEDSTSNIPPNAINANNLTFEIRAQC